MAKLVWDQIGERLYETGVKKGVVYPQVSGTYPKGEAWNGLISVTESPSGAEASPLYANDSKYLDLISKEEYGASVEAYTYPEAFGACCGEKEHVAGVKVSQQPRKAFGLSFVTTIGNDELGDQYGYKIHLVYGAKAAPSEKSHTSINESPEAATMSWELTTTPVEIPGFENAAHIEIDSTKVNAEQLKQLEDMLYGTMELDAKLPLPSELFEIFTPSPEAASVQG